jgi:predicted DNA-binding protein (MmcQ/YjbR family)
MAEESGAHDSELETLFEFGLGYPGAHVKSPWPGHRDLAVKDKTFAYLSLPGEPLGVSCKLPASCGEALRLPFASPTEYGLGKSGWVSARFEPGEEVPVDMLRAWIDESYRAQAPKRLSAGVPPLGGSPEAEVKAVRARKKPAARPLRASAAAPAKGVKKARARAARRGAQREPSVQRAAAKQGAAKKNAARNVKAAKRPRRKATAAKRG